MRRPVGIIVWTAAAIALGGCHVLPLSRLTPLPTAHQVPIDQLVFHTDFDLPKDDLLVRSLIAERSYVSDTLNLPPSTEPIHIYLFRDEGAYAKFLAEQFPSVPSRRAFFVESDTQLAVYAHWSERMGEDLRHEVAHGYLHASVPSLPLWLDEGLAEYFEVPRGSAGLNPPHVDLLTDMTKHNNWQPNLPRLEKLNSASEMGQADYAEAWAWVYFMLESDPERHSFLTGYLKDLRDRGKAEPLSERLASRHIDPQRTMQEYLASLKTDEGVVKR